MPKLIIGGVDYGAYPTDAGDISYDNTSSGLSATKVQGAIDEVHTQLSAIIDVIYPVGSIYLSVTDSTADAVAARFGGTWVRIAEGETLFGYKSGDTNFGTVGGEGGATSVNIQHSHTVNDHSHTIGGSTGQASGSTGQSSGSTGGPSTTNTSGPSTANTGDCTLQTTQIPSHYHVQSLGTHQAVVGGGSYHTSSQVAGEYATAVNNATAYQQITLSTGGGKAHSHSLNSHTHTLSDHTHSLNSHTHSLNSHTHTLPSDTGTKTSLGTNNQLSTTQSIINPYVTVYMYKRTA